MTTHDPLKLARDALQKLACLGNGDKPGNSTGNVIALTTLAAIDAMPARAPVVAWHMLVIGCDGSADWCELGAGHPETQPGVEALPLVYAQASVPAWPCHCDEQGIGVPGETCGDCPRDYGHTVAPAGAPSAPAPATPPGMVLVPLRMTQAMRDVTDTGEWEWADLLAAANAVTPAEYEAAQAAPAPASASMASAPAAWMHPDDGRVIPASTMEQARKDGGASLPSVRGYTVALGPIVANPQAAPAPAPLLVRDLAASVKAQPLDVSKVLESLGYGPHSLNAAVPAGAVRAVETYFAARTQAQAAPAPASVPAGWRMEAMAPYGYAVHAPSGAACIVCESDDSPRIVPTVVLAELCRDLLATVAAPAVAAPEPRTLTGAQIERHGMPASECPPDSVVMLVSSIRRLSGMAAAPTTQEPE